ncbi:MAG TPA: helix-turn-helix domain-containing protein [Nocardioidaceae bacterium]|nr:helix-turn-helix domain-containing protein [Nocardioidaceae bacterium]
MQEPSIVSTRSSPPTDRVLDVLDFLAGRPGERFGLSDLARNLRMSKPTCLGIVNALTARGYLVREPHGLTYGLGPALMAAGRAAQEGFAVSHVARPHLEALSERYGAACTASAVVGDQIMVLERAGPAQGTARVGQHYPFAPPVGLMYVLWDRDEALERWLAKRPTLPLHLDRPHLRTVVQQCRRRGYLVESLTPTGLRLHTLMAGVAAYDLPPRVRDLIDEMASNLGERVLLDADLSARRKHPVNLIAAPTYDADGRQELVLALHVGDSVTGAEINRRATALVAAADAVTAGVGG